MKQYMQARPRLSDIDLSYLEERLFMENISPNRAWEKPVNAFGPILPTAFSLPIPGTQFSLTPFPQSRPDLLFPVIQTRAELPVTRLNSPALMTPSRPLDAFERVMTPSRSSRRTDKQADLEAVERFLEESRAVHERLYANLDLIKVQHDHRIVEEAQSIGSLVDANNVAELRRTIATRYTPQKARLSVGSPSGMLAPTPQKSRLPVGSPAGMLVPSPQKTRLPVGSPPGMLVPTPQKTRLPAGSPDRHVSGVFVSYPRRGESAAQPVDHPANEMIDLISSNRPSKRPGEKMSALEFIALRGNLLSRSEQHVHTAGTSPYS